MLLVNVEAQCKNRAMVLCAAIMQRKNCDLCFFLKHFWGQLDSKHDQTGAQIVKDLTIFHLCNCWGDNAKWQHCCSSSGTENVKSQKAKFWQFNLRDNDSTMEQPFWFVIFSHWMNSVTKLLALLCQWPSILGWAKVTRFSTASVFNPDSNSRSLNIALQKQFWLAKKM